MSQFQCTTCQSIFRKWSGQCHNCKEWNTLEESNQVLDKKSLNRKKSIKAIKSQNLYAVMEQNSVRRYMTGLLECDRVLSGGFPENAVVLVGGEPGIGKSTLVLQFAQYIAQNIDVLYVSAEESINQIAQRLKRIDSTASKIQSVYATHVEQILLTIEEEKPRCVILDSIQMVASADISSAAGSASQVRYAAEIFTQHAKEYGYLLIIIGHVTKDGNVAGPKALEHIVDTVLFLEGQRSGTMRFLRAFKNRFGVVDEVGIFRMTKSGLIDIEDPSQYLLAERNTQAFGSALSVIVEGNRSFVIEIQALVTRTAFGYPKRSSNGFPAGRLDILIAVMQKYLGMKLESFDVYVNVVGGLSFTDRSLDLAIISAIISSYHKRALSKNSVFFGEVGLTGEIRGVEHKEKRMKALAQMKDIQIVSSYNDASVRCKHVQELEI